MTASKTWKQSLAWYSIWLQPKYAARTVANDKLWLTFESSVEICVDWTSFNFRFKWAICYWKKHVLCFWSTIYFSVLKSCPKFKFSVLIFLWEMTKWSALSKKKLQSENMSIPTYFKCNTMLQKRVCYQKFWNVSSGLDFQLEQSLN